MRKIICIFLSVVLCMGMFVSAFAYTDVEEEDYEVENEAEEIVDEVEIEAEEPETAETYYINPLYEDVAAEEDLAEVSGGGIQTFSSQVFTDDVDGAAEVIREGLVAREEEITVCFDVDYNVGDSFQEVHDQLSKELFKAAVEHTGVGDEGDYLLLNYTGWRAKSSISSTNGYSHNVFNITYTVTYHTIEKQEERVTSAVNKVLDSFDWTDESNYEKLCDIYEWICTNVAYDYDNLNDDSYELKYTAYAAIIDNKAVCQGFASLLYRMCLDAGIDCRVITGTYKGEAHAWNIVELDGLYYNVDATLDSNFWQTKNWEYFLKADNSFVNHERGRGTNYSPDYTASVFYANYPMALTDYDSDTDVDGNVDSNVEETHTHTPGEWVIVTPANCVTEGYQEQYCIDCGVLLDSAVIPATGHTEQTVEGKAATCTEAGYTESTVCSVCGETLTESTQIDALGHMVVIDEAVAPTCFESGLTEGSHCSVCDTVIIEQEVVPATGEHDYEVIDQTDASCETSGSITYKCTVCGDIYTEELEALGHDYQLVEKVESTCTSKGYEHYVCTVCGEEFTAVLDEAPHTPVIDEGYSAACTTDGLSDGCHCAECGKVLREQKTIDALGHDVTIDEAVAPTCTEDGLTEGSHCSRCNEVFAEQTIVSATGHNYIVRYSKDASCTEDGIIEYMCENCGDVYTETVDKLGHDYEIVSQINPTCTEDGQITYKCTMCGDEYSEVILSSGHSIVMNDGYAATCTSNGLTSESYCSVCGEVFETAEVIEATGHDFSYYDNGDVHTVYCKNCQMLYTEDHEYDEDGVCVICGHELGIVSENVTDENDDIDNQELEEDGVQTNDTSRIWLVVEIAAVVITLMLIALTFEQRTKKVG